MKIKEAIETAIDTNDPRMAIGVAETLRMAGCDYAGTEAIVRRIRPKAVKDGTWEQLLYAGDVNLSYYR